MFVSYAWVGPFTAINHKFIEQRHRPIRVCPFVYALFSISVGISISPCLADGVMNLILLSMNRVICEYLDANRSQPFLRLSYVHYYFGHSWISMCFTVRPQQRTLPVFSIVVFVFVDAHVKVITKASRKSYTYYALHYFMTRLWCIELSSASTSTQITQILCFSSAAVGFAVPKTASAGIATL